MTNGIIVKRKVHFRVGERSRKRIEVGERHETPARGHIPRVARLMALAVRFDGMIRDGVVRDQADLARLGHVTRARLTQIMNLLALAPSIQESLLFLPLTSEGRDPIVERHLRPIAAEPDWGKQRRMWAELLHASSG